MIGISGLLSGLNSKLAIAAIAAAIIAGGLLVWRVQVGTLRHEIQGLTVEHDTARHQRDQARDAAETAEAATRQAIEDARRADRAALEASRRAAEARSEREDLEARLRQAVQDHGDRPASPVLRSIWEEGEAQ